MNEFYKTPMGRKFYENDLPKLVSVLEKIANRMEESNKLNEKRFLLEERLMKHQLKEINESLNSKSPAVKPRRNISGR
jgi:hypothetical protein